MPINGGTAVDRSLSAFEFRKLALKHAIGIIKRLRTKEETAPGSDFVKREPTPLLRAQSLTELADYINTQLDSLVKDFARLQSFKDEISPSLQIIVSQESALRALDAYEQLVKVESHWIEDTGTVSSDDFSLTADAKRVYFSVTGGGNDVADFERAILNDDQDTRFLASVSRTLSVRGRRFTADETAGAYAAYALLEQGNVLPSAYQPLGRTGFRLIHTCLSLADPGEGHINVTCNNVRFLRGMVVHVEHIDRDKEFNKDLIEAYRLPAAINAARVRMHIGTDAPCTAFIGRPVFESGNFKRDLLKSVHMTASACTAMFMNGFADCKLGMDSKIGENRMSAAECVEFMRYVVGNVIRNSTNQYLSAAFNVNTPFVNDLSSDLPANPTSRFDIALLGITVAQLGGFNKVAWDGAENKVPSTPVTDQLTHEEMVDLVHKAHESGLETYVSAGMYPVDIKKAVYAGVDGVGIGTSLHYMDPQTKLMGELKAQLIEDTLQHRDDAAAEWLGKAASLLARMDRMFFEGSLSEADETSRINLYQSVRSKDESRWVSLATKLAHIAQMPPDSGNSVISHARRLLEAADQSPLIQSRLGGKQFASLMRSVDKLVVEKDVEQLKEILI
ncbi:MAG: hypothetical protein C0473_01200 [Cyanobacteria bacterium DS3.002]|nr:hypothetical protein [Cyanobacteria bacterium DS3.002]